MMDARISGPLLAGVGKASSMKASKSSIKGTNTLIFNLQVLTTINNMNFNFVDIQGNFDVTVRAWVENNFEDVAKFAYEKKEENFYNKEIDSKYITSYEGDADSFSLNLDKLNTTKLSLTFNYNSLSMPSLNTLGLNVELLESKPFNMSIGCHKILSLLKCGDIEEFKIKFLNDTSFEVLDSGITLLVPVYNMTLVHEPFSYSSIAVTHGDTTNLKPRDAIGIRAFSGDTIAVSVPSEKSLHLCVYNFSSFKGDTERFFIGGTFSTYIHKWRNSIKTIYPIFDPSDKVIYSTHNNSHFEIPFSSISFESAQFGDSIRNLVPKNSSICGFLQSNDTQYIYINDFKADPYKSRHIIIVVLVTTCCIGILHAIGKILLRYKPEWVNNIFSSTLWSYVITFIFVVFFVSLILLLVQKFTYNYQYVGSSRELSFYFLSASFVIFIIFIQVLHSKGMKIRIKFITCICISIFALASFSKFYCHSFILESLCFDVSLIWGTIEAFEIILTCCADLGTLPCSLVTTIIESLKKNSDAWQKASDVWRKERVPPNNRKNNFIDSVTEASDKSCGALFYLIFCCTCNFFDVIRKNAVSENYETCAGCPCCGKPKSCCKSLWSSLKRKLCPPFCKRCFRRCKARCDCSCCKNCCSKLFPYSLLSNDNSTSNVADPLGVGTPISNGE